MARVFLGGSKIKSLKDTEHVFRGAHQLACFDETGDVQIAMVESHERLHVTDNKVQFFLKFTHMFDRKTQNNFGRVLNNIRRAVSEGIQNEYLFCFGKKRVIVVLKNAIPVAPINRFIVGKFFVAGKNEKRILQKFRIVANKIKRKRGATRVINGSGKN